MASPPPTPTAYAGAIGAGEYGAQGMIAPLNAFVDSSGILVPVSFRFLNSLFRCVQNLEHEMATIQQRLANAGIP